MIVGLLGFIGSGKGTVGEILLEQGFHQISFAAAVKDVASVMFGWPRELLEGDTNTSRDFRENKDAFWSEEFRRDFTPRQALQLIGTEVGRNIFHEDFWVIKVKNELRNKNVNFVVTDVRFPNEMKMIQDMGGILILVERGYHPHWFDIASKANHGDVAAERFMKERADVHESEWRWIGNEIDYTIDNNGTKEELKKKVMNCLTQSYGASIIEESFEGAL